MDLQREQKACRLMEWLCSLDKGNRRPIWVLMNKPYKAVHLAHVFWFCLRRWMGGGWMEIVSPSTLRRWMGAGWRMILLPIRPKLASLSEERRGFGSVIGASQIYLFRPYVLNPSLGTPEGRVQDQDQDQDDEQERVRSPKPENASNS